MALVSLGAAAFTLCSMYGFLTAASLSESTKYDPSRMASNVASGVGFIGAGVITNNRKAAGVYDRKSTVGGLTTAAAIWTSAAIGVASGVGLYFISFVATVSTITILQFGKVNNGDWGKRMLSSGIKQKRKAAVVAPKSNETDAEDVRGPDLNVTATPLGDRIKVPNAVAVLGDSIAAQRHVWDLHNKTRLATLLDETSENKVTADDEKTHPELNQSGAGRNQDLTRDAGNLKERSNAVSEMISLWNSSTVLTPEQLADPLLAKHIWGLNNNSTVGYNAILPPSFPTRHSIEEEQEIVWRKGKDEPGRGG